MRYLLDSDVLIWLTRRRPPPALVERVTGTPREDMATSSIVIAEMVRGAHRHSERSDYLLAEIRDFLGRFPVLPFDVAAAYEYGRIDAYLTGQGMTIGMGDTLIAASALAHGLTVVTGNVRHFTRVPGLEVENWIA